MKIQYEIKGNTLEEITYNNDTYKKGELVSTYSKGFFEIVEIKKKWDAPKKAYIEFDPNNFWHSAPEIKLKKRFTSNGNKINSKATRTVNISSIYKIDTTLKRLETIKDRAIKEYENVKKVIDENKV